MSPYEIEAYIRGINRRTRDSWHQARFLGYCQLAPWSKNVTPESLLSFPWEEKQNKKQKNDNAEAIKALMKRAKDYETKLNSENDGK